MYMLIDRTMERLMDELQCTVLVHVHAHVQMERLVDEITAHLHVHVIHVNRYM